MTGTQLAALIRYKTKTDTATFLDADILVLVNIYKDEIAGQIQVVRPEIWNIPTTDDLVADQREYAFPSDVMNNLVKLELKFTASGDLVETKSIKRNDYNNVIQESVIVAHFDNIKPCYFIRRQAIYILSGTIIAVTDGIELVYNAFPVNLANVAGSTDLSVDPSTTTHGFPKEFHELWARRVSIAYKDRNEVRLSKKELDYDRDLEKKLDEFSTVDLSQSLTGKLPSSDKTGDDGFNY